MPTALQLRLANQADAPFLSAFGAQTFESAFGLRNEPADMRAYLAQAFSLQSISNEIAEPNAQFFIASLENEIVGYSKIQIGMHANLTHKKPTTELQRIYVDSEKLGIGLGKQLLFLTLAEAIKINMLSIWLGVWEKNKAAIRFYQKWGFETQASHSFTLGKDIQRDLLLTRALPENITDLSKEFTSEI